MWERVERQGRDAAKLPQHLCMGPVLPFLVLTALWGAHVPEMPQHMLPWKGNSCLFTGADKFPAPGTL